MRLHRWVLGLALSGCTPGGTLPDGRWVLEGHGLGGGLDISSGKATVQLQGEAWSTNPDGVTAKLGGEDPRHPWLYFPVQTAAGKAEAALELDLEHGRAKLPLGYRPGEHLYTLTLTPGEATAMPPLAALDALQRAWLEGGFSLFDSSGQLSGLIVLLPGDQAQVQLITATAMTIGPVPAIRRAEGPDQLLAFSVEPRFAEETGLLRLNIPTMKAVLPVDHQPHADDRWLVVKPGLPDQAQLDQRISQVRDEALRLEHGLVTRLAVELSGAALIQRAAEGRCPTSEELQPDWKLLLEDYRLTVRETPGDCIVHLEPHLVQHTRRTAVTATALGLIEVEVLGAQ